jgi:hypothetical protein
MVEMNMKPEEKLEGFFIAIANQVFQEVIRTMSSQTPDLLLNFQVLHDEIALNTKEMLSSFKNIERKLKKIIDSPSLYEDVYKMRDELIEIKKLLKINQHNP